MQDCWGPRRAANQIFLLYSGSVIANDSKGIALIFFHFAHLLQDLTSLNSFEGRAKQRQLPGGESARPRNSCPHANERETSFNNNITTTHPSQSYDCRCVTSFSFRLSASQWAVCNLFLFKLFDIELSAWQPVSSTWPARWFCSGHNCLGFLDISVSPILSNPSSANAAKMHL